MLLLTQVAGRVACLIEMFCFCVFVAFSFECKTVGVAGCFVYFGLFIDCFVTVFLGFGGLSGWF